MKFLVFKRVVFVLMIAVIAISVLIPVGTAFAASSSTPVSGTTVEICYRRWWNRCSQVDIGIGKKMIFASQFGTKIWVANLPPYRYQYSDDEIALNTLGVDLRYELGCQVGYTFHIHERGYLDADKVLFSQYKGCAITKLVVYGRK